MTIKTLSVWTGIGSREKTGKQTVGGCFVYWRPGKTGKQDRKALQFGDGGKDRKV